jgi:twitching motility protein PilT
VEENVEEVPLNEIPGISASDTWVTEAQQKPSLIDELAANPVSTESKTEEVIATPSVSQLDAGLSMQTVKGKSKRYSYSIEQLLDIVIEKNGSDLHLQSGYPAMVRVDGSLLPVSKDLVTTENISELILPVMDEEKRDRFEVNREVDLAYAHGDKARFRVNAFHQKQSMAAAFRLIPTKIKSLEDLKLPPIYYELAKMHQGLVLVTGPTGHGKSTTLAAIIQEINRTRDARILTIEDPIEYIFPPSRAMIAQREIQDDTHSWEIALKSALREDPDVILVGEMRDYETIASVITLAETGHLVFATLHTNSASQTIDRIIDVFPENQQSQIRAQLANVVEAVIAQRLIPLDKGGRKAASEIMLVNPAVRTLIREGKTHQLDNVIRTSADLGMISLESSLVKMVRDNEITMDKASRYALRPEEVIRLLKG